MKILVVSDTHRSNGLYLQLVKKYEPLDMIIHCGDIEGSEYTISEASACPVHMVAGNNDFFSDMLQDEEEFMIGSHKAFLTHGHRYRISIGNEILKDEARSRGADVVFYGHTHRPLVEHENGLLVVNPGSLSYPRQEGRRPSYAILEEDKEGNLEAKIYFLS